MERGLFSRPGPLTARHGAARPQLKAQATLPTEARGLDVGLEPRRERCPSDFERAFMVDSRTIREVVTLKGHTPGYCHHDSVLLQRC